MAMRDDDLYNWIAKAANHPIVLPVVYGLAAGVVRFIMGDKTAGWRALVTSVAISMFVAAGSTYYLIDEPYSDGKKLFFTIIAAFLARDLLVALSAIGEQFRQDPAGFFRRVREALNGSKPQ